MHPLGVGVHRRATGAWMFGAQIGRTWQSADRVSATPGYTKGILCIFSRLSESTHGNFAFLTGPPDLEPLATSQIYLRPIIVPLLRRAPMGAGLLL